MTSRFSDNFLIVHVSKSNSILDKEIEDNFINFH